MLGTNWIHRDTLLSKFRNYVHRQVSYRVDGPCSFFFCNGMYTFHSHNAGSTTSFGAHKLSSAQLGFRSNERIQTRVDGNGWCIDCEEKCKKLRYALLWQLLIFGTIIRNNVNWIAIILNKWMNRRKRYTIDKNYLTGHDNVKSFRKSFSQTSMIRWTSKIWFTHLDMVAHW